MWSASPELPRNGYVFDLGEYAEAATKYGIIPDIFAEDYIFNATYHYFKKNFGKSVEHYFLSGRVSATNIQELIPPRLRQQPLEFLDFASGYGCVARHIRNVFPGANVTAMDIHEKAFYFNQNNLKIKAALSSVEPAGVTAPGQFDVVFALSFFSHMPRRTQMLWLAKLSEFVKPGGILIFTTHGETSHKTQMPDIPIGDDGYGFIAESEQFDLSTADYGHAVTYKRFMLPQVEKLDGMNLLDLREGFWWTHQDTYVLTKAA
jgi:SAM-dependent methyltransferase